MFTIRMFDNGGPSEFVEQTDAGRCSAWVHIMEGQNNIQVQAYDPSTGETGKVAEIPYNYVVSE